MTELIVALDGPAPLGLVTELYSVGVRWIKIGPQAMTDTNWHSLLLRPGGRIRDPMKVFLDLKIADTRATVYEAVKRFSEAGIAAISTFTDAATEAAVEAARGSDLRVWRVVRLTDDDSIVEYLKIVDRINGPAHGLIMPPWIAEWLEWRGAYVNHKAVICPAVRLTENAEGHARGFDALECSKGNVIVAVPSPKPYDCGRGGDAA